MILVILSLLIGFVQTSEFDKIKIDLLNLRDDMKTEQNKIMRIAQEEPENLSQLMKEFNTFRDGKFDTKVSPILSKYGYPLYTLDSLSNNLIGNIIISMRNDSISSLYLDGLKKAADQKFINWRNLAGLIDHLEYNISESKTQIYGTNYRPVIDKKLPYKYTLAPIRNLLKVDSLRATVGLEPLLEFCKRNRIKIPDSY